MKQKNITRPYIHQFYKGNGWRVIMALVGSALSVATNLLISYLLQITIDACAGVDVGLELIEMVWLALACIGVGALSYLAAYVSKPRFRARAIEQYKAYVFDKLTKKGVAAFGSENTASYISILSNDCNSIENGYLVNIFNIIECVALLIGALVMMLCYSPLLTAISIALSLLPLICAILTGTTVAKAEKAISDENEKYMSTLKDSLSGFSVVKAFKAEEHLFGLFKQKAHAVANAQTKRSKLSTVVEMISMCAGVIVQFGVFIFGAFLALNGNGITAGVVIIFVQLLNFVINPIGVIPQALSEIKSSKALIAKAAELLEQNVNESGDSISPTLSDGISVKSLSFSFDGSHKVLDDVSFKFEVGKSYAIVGASGSGKSTLLSMLMASHQSFDGDILVDNKSILDISTSSLYDAISLIQQNVFIFNATLKENISMFSNVNESELDLVIKLSGLKALVDERGLNFDCGEGGCNLSGGERQRIAIARALLRHSSVLLADEITAALDAETSYNISSAILSLEDITRIVVTHDLDSGLLKKYDCIITMKQGGIAESGTFDSLMAQKGYFYSLFTVSQ